MPCGTPETTSIRLDYLPSTTTLCFLGFFKLQIHSQIFSRIPMSMINEPQDMLLKFTPSNVEERDIL